MKRDQKGSHMGRRLGFAGALIMAFMLVFREPEESSRPKIVWVDTTKGAAP